MTLHILYSTIPPVSRPSKPPADVTPPPPASESRKISRREFGRGAAIATAVSFGACPRLTTRLSPASSAIDPTNSVLEAGSAGEPAVSPQEKKTDPLKGLTPQQVADVEAKHANILRKYGSRFNDAQKNRLQRILAQNERLLAPVRAFEVQNGDAPASVLRVTFDQLSLTNRDGGAK